MLECFRVAINGYFFVGRLCNAEIIVQIRFLFRTDRRACLYNTVRAAEEPKLSWYFEVGLRIHLELMTYIIIEESFMVEVFEKFDNTMPRLIDSFPPTGGAALIRFLLCTGQSAVSIVYSVGICPVSFLNLSCATTRECPRLRICSQ
jgi:hypothetical protein